MREGRRREWVREGAGRETRGELFAALFADYAPRCGPAWGGHGGVAHRVHRTVVNDASLLRQPEAFS